MYAQGGNDNAETNTRADANTKPRLTLSWDFRYNRNVEQCHRQQIGITLIATRFRKFQLPTVISIQ